MRSAQDQRQDLGSAVNSAVARNVNRVQRSFGNFAAIRVNPYNPWRISFPFPNELRLPAEKNLQVFFDRLAGFAQPGVGAGRVGGAAGLFKGEGDVTQFVLPVAKLNVWRT